MTPARLDYAAGHGPPVARDLDGGGFEVALPEPPAARRRAFIQSVAVLAVPAAVLLGFAVWEWSSKGFGFSGFLDALSPALYGLLMLAGLVYFIVRRSSAEAATGEMAVVARYDAAGFSLSYIDADLGVVLADFAVEDARLLGARAVRLRFGREAGMLVLSAKRPRPPGETRWLRIKRVLVSPLRLPRRLERYSLLVGHPLAHVELVADRLRDAAGLPRP